MSLKILVSTATAVLGIIGFVCIILKTNKFQRRRRGMSIAKKLLSLFRTRLLLHPKHLAIVNSRDECSAALNRILRDCREHRYVGFDCEWRPQTVRGQPTRPVALLQLASPKGSCVLFRLCNIGFIPEDVKAVLRDPNLLKVGVVPLSDAKKLFKDYSAPVHGCLDLRYLLVSENTNVSSSTRQPTRILNYPSSQDLANKDKLKGNINIETYFTNSEYSATANGERNIESTEIEVYNDSEQTTMSTCTITSNNVPGLAKMAQDILGVTLNKNWRVRCSDWEAVHLSPDQVTYAVNDVLVAALLFARLTNLSKPWKLPWKHRYPSPSWDQVKQKYHRFVDSDFRINMKTGMKTFQKKILQPAFKPQVRQFKALLHSTPLYDNCCILAPDGELLCTCKKRKALWYLSKGLGEEVEHPNATFAIRLKFEPSARASHPHYKYYTLFKLNVCVVCGGDHSYVKKNIVPHEYRIYFPKSIKDYRSHDILLICLKCIDKLERSSHIVRKQLDDLSTSSSTVKKFSVCHPIQKVVSAAKALLYKADQIPEHRTKELVAILSEYFQIPISDSIPHKFLKEASELNSIKMNTEYEPHGLQVVRYFQALYGENEGVWELERMWRSHFLNTMKPQHLPEYWRVDHLHT